MEGIGLLGIILVPFVINHYKERKGMQNLGVLTVEGNTQNQENLRKMQQELLTTGGLGKLSKKVESNLRKMIMFIILMGIGEITI